MISMPSRTFRLTGITAMKPSHNPITPHAHVSNNTKTSKPTDWRAMQRPAGASTVKVRGSRGHRVPPSSRCSCHSHAQLEGLNGNSVHVQRRPMHHTLYTFRLLSTAACARVDCGGCAQTRLVGVMGIVSDTQVSATATCSMIVQLHMGEQA